MTDPISKSDAFSSHRNHAGLDGIVAGATSLSTVGVEGVGLTYRGYAIEDLAGQGTFEEVAYLLLFGELPTAAGLSQFRSRLQANRPIPDALIEVLRQIPPNAHPMDVLRTGISMLGTLEPESTGTGLAVAERLLVVAPTILLSWYRHHQNVDRFQLEQGESIAEQFLWGLHDQKPEPLAVCAMDLSLILYAEHEWNASTFTARVIASTLSDFYSAITGAIGALRGPLHGGANEAAMELISQMQDADHAEKRLMEMLASKEKVMGFGHRVYKKNDPRSDLIKPWAMRLCEATGRKSMFEISEKIEEVMMREKKIFPNVDFYAASLYHCLGIPTDMFTPIFVLSRIAGWSAHILEQRKDNRLIRPLAQYIGPAPRNWVAMEDRR
ncbi:MAG: citrate/2-methylcitrate synthase [Pirellulaceae bacterium]